MLCGLLAAGVLLIIGNVVSLMLQQHRQEMRVYCLMGASDFFTAIFLYSLMTLAAFAWPAWRCVGRTLIPCCAANTQYTLMQQISGLNWLQGGLCCAFGAFLPHGCPDFCA